MREVDLDSSMSSWCHYKKKNTQTLNICTFLFFFFNCANVDILNCLRYDKTKTIYQGREAKHKRGISQYALGFYK